MTSLFAADDYPVYVSQVNPHDYTLFANSGWDGNWYVGYNTCWIKRLPPIPAGTYKRAFIGAKLGRMKRGGESKNVWDTKPVAGEIYMAISSTTSWARENGVRLTTTREIPLEGDYESAVEGTGEAKWFWTEIPLKDVNFSGANYLALWSPTPGLISVSSSPVLAAAWGGKEQDTWLSRDLQGVPPRKAAELGTSISYFQPAIALKLIPQSAVHPIKVQITGWKDGSGDRPKPVVTARVEGEGIENVWMEFSSLNGSWSKLGRPLFQPPYMMSVDPTQLPPGRVQLRVSARNMWEERGTSTPFSVEISTSAAAKKIH